MNHVWYKLFFFCLILFFCTHKVSCVEELTFQLLEKLPALEASSAVEVQIPKEIMHFHNSEVHIRGFLFRSTEGELLLASEPNLKSCCVGSQEKITRQLVIAGNLELPKGFSKAVSLEGRFRVDPIKDKGRWQRIYILENAHYITENRGEQPGLLYALGAGLLAIGPLLFFCRRALQRLLPAMRGRR